MLYLLNSHFGGSKAEISYKGIATSTCFINNNLAPGDNNIFSPNPQASSLTCPKYTEDNASSFYQHKPQNSNTDKAKNPTEYPTQCCPSTNISHGTEIGT